MTVVDLYTIQIIDDGGGNGQPIHDDEGVMAEIMAEIEENITDLLPSGYRARARKWDTPTQEDNDE